MENNSSNSEESKLKIIYNALFPNGPNSDKINIKERIIITFAGIPSSGKSTISKEIEKKYGGIRIDGDDIMKVVGEKKLAETIKENEQMKSKFIRFLLKNIQSKNKIIILDRSIDREYINFFRLCEENKCNYFIIQIELDKQEAIKRFKRRNSHNLDNWLPRLDNWIKDHEEFKKNVKSNISLNGEAQDVEMLLKELDAVINNSTTLNHK